jgi:hypothetical protein
MTNKNVMKCDDCIKTKHVMFLAKEQAISRIACGLSAIKYYKCCVCLTCVELSIRLVFLATYSHFLYWQNSICGVMISDLDSIS